MSAMLRPSAEYFGGVKYLSWLLKRFNGDTCLAVAVITRVKATWTNMVAFPIS